MRFWGSNAIITFKRQGNSQCGAFPPPSQRPRRDGKILRIDCPALTVLSRVRVFRHRAITKMKSKMLAVSPQPTAGISLCPGGLFWA